MSDPTQPPSGQTPSAPSPSQPFGGGISSGDPLGGSGGASAPSAPPSYPPGYSSPAPPGAGGSPGFSSAPAPGSHRLAGWGSRLAAQIIDGLILAVPSFLLLLIFGVGVANSDGGAGTGAAIGGLLLSLLLYLVVSLLYAPTLMSRWNGQTVGRRVMNVRVIRADGQPMTFGFAALREIAVKGLLVGVAGSVTFGLGYLVNYLWPLWDDENRALHDMVVNTRVVQA